MTVKILENIIICQTISMGFWLQKCLLIVLISYYCSTNYQKCHALKQHTLNYLGVLEVRSLKWISLHWSQGVSRAAFILDTQGENPFPYTFLILEASFPDSGLPSFIFKASNIWSSPFHPTGSLVLSALPWSSTSKDLCDYIGPTWTILLLGWKNLPISRSADKES